MNRRANHFIILIAIGMLTLGLPMQSCQLFSDEKKENETAMRPDSLMLLKGKRVPNMVLAPPDSIGPLDWGAHFDDALLQQTLYLVRPSTRQKPLNGIKKQDLVGTINKLQSWKTLSPQLLYEYFDFYRIQTDQQAEKVRLTGYYTPSLKVSRKKTAVYSVPLLRRPTKWLGAPLSAEQIYQGALHGKGLEIAWCKNQKTLRNAQLQGSCMLEYPDGQRKFLGYGGTNKSLSQNADDDTTDKGKAYVFFQERGTNAWGAAGFPLTEDYSVAVDQHVIPLGACLLARIPIRDSLGHTTYLHRIVMAQDMGGAVKTTNHIDLYCGVGAEGLQKVNQIAGYGKLWLMLPKKPKDSAK
jgi:membrane-bound lytic murein transglycosylase